MRRSSNKHRRRRRPKSDTPKEATVKESAPKPEKKPAPKAEKVPAEQAEAAPKAEGEAKKPHRRRPNYRRRPSKPKQNTEG